MDNSIADHLCSRLVFFLFNFYVDQRNNQTLGECMKRIIIDSDTDTGYSKEFFDKEQARAVKEIINSDNFVLVYHSKNGGGGAISCLAGEHILPMTFQVNKMNNELMNMCKGMIKKGMLNQSVMDLMKGVKDGKGKNGNKAGNEKGQS